jgi:Uma2 family endonuclease
MTAAEQPAPAEGKVDFSRSYTREEYFQLPEGPPYHELIDGKLDPTPHPWLRHQMFLGSMLVRLRPYAMDERAGMLLSKPNLLLPGTENVYHPDFLYLAPGRSRALNLRWVEGAPDMVCEVLFHGSERRDRHRKLPVYRQARVPHLWLIEPEPPLTVEEYILAPSGRYELYSITSAPAVWSPRLFPEWSLDLGEVQEEIAFPDEIAPEVPCKLKEGEAP